MNKKENKVNNVNKMNFKRLKYGIFRRIYKNNPVKYTKNKFEYYMGYKLNLKCPKTFNEKLQWVKLFYYNELYEKCSDKVEVRDYVKEKHLENILTKLYGVYNSLDEINFDELPQKFMIKTTHSSGGGYVVKDKNEIDFDKMSQIINQSLATNLYPENYEWQYKNLKPRIMVEELIETDKPDLIDYKFFCFNGKVKYIYVSIGTTTIDEFAIDFYDENWNYLNVKREHHKNFGKIEKPEKFEEMKKVVEKLSEDFTHVRVDLYNENDRIYFGELTFTTGSGYGKFEPESFDTELGKYFDLEKLKLTNQKVNK